MNVTFPGSPSTIKQCYDPAHYIIINREVPALKKRVASAEADADMHHSKSIDLTIEITQLKKILANKDAAVQEMKSSMSLMAKQETDVKSDEDLKVHNRYLSEKLRESETDVQQLENLLKESNESGIRLQNKFDATQKELDKRSIENAELSRDFSNLLEDLQSARSETETLKKKLTDLQEEHLQATEMANNFKPSLYGRFGTPYVNGVSIAEISDDNPNVSGSNDMDLLNVLNRFPKLKLTPASSKKQTKKQDKIFSPAKQSLTPFKKSVRIAGRPHRLLSWLRSGKFLFKNLLPATEAADDRKYAAIRKNQTKIDEEPRGTYLKPEALTPIIAPTKGNPFIASTEKVSTNSTKKDENVAVPKIEVSYENEINDIRNYYKKVTPTKIVTRQIKIPKGYSIITSPEQLGRALLRALDKQDSAKGRKMSTPAKAHTSQQIM